MLKSPPAGRYVHIRHDDNPALFVTQGEDPIRLHAQGMWKRFHRYAKHAGIGKRVHPHMLRHTMATTLLANGCPIGHIRAMLGHEHLTTTCKYYLVGTNLFDSLSKGCLGPYLIVF